MQEDVKIAGLGKRIILDFPNLAGALKLWQPWSDKRRRAEVTGSIHLALRAAGLSLEIRVQGKSVALLGGEQMSGLALQLLDCGGPR